MHRSIRTGAAWLVYAALAGGGVIAYATAQGVGISPDSVSYVAISRSIAAGRGLVGITHGTEFHRPPMYPIALAAVAKATGTDPLDAARWLQVALFAVLVLLVGTAIRDDGRGSPAAAVLGIGLVATARDVLLVHVMAWSEPLSLVLVLAGALLVARHVATGLWWPVWSATVLFALALLTRYAAVVFPPACAIAILVARRDSVRRRLLAGALLNAGAAVPLAILLAWSRISGDRGTNRDFVIHPVATGKLASGARTMASWVLPVAAPVWADLLALLTLVVLATTATVATGRLVGRRIGPESAVRPADTVALALLVGVGAYVLFLVFSISFIDAQTPLDPRILAPAHALLVVATAIVADGLLPSARRRRLAVAAALALIAGQTVGSWAFVRQSRVRGLEFGTRRWRQSELIRSVAALPSDVVVYSNAYDAVYLYTNRPAHPIPASTNPNSIRPNPALGAQLAALADTTHTTYVAYFNAVPWRWYMLTQADLGRRVGLTLVRNVRDGVLYQVGPAVGADAR